MNSVPRLSTARQLLTTGLLIAAVVTAVLVWVNRTAPAATALNNLSGPAVHDLIMERHDDGEREICGEDVTADYVGAVVAHGLDSTSEVPAEAVAEIERLGSNLNDHEQRHFDTHRLLLISWDATTKDLGEGYGAEFGSVYELHYWEDEISASVGWGVVYSGTVFECRPEDLAR